MKTFFNFILNKRTQIYFLFAGLVLLSGYALMDLPVDAVPDITNVQVMINTGTGALDPEQIEKAVTKPIETEMGGLPSLVEVRSISKYGLSQVNLIFADGTDLYKTRTLVAQRLQKIATSLPDEITPELAPATTGLGEVFMYTLEYVPKDNPLSEKDRLIYLRTIQEQVVRPELKKITDVAEVDTNGGYNKEIHINLDPQKMKQYGLRLEEVFEKINTIGESFGGGYIETKNQQILVKSTSPADSLEFLKKMPLKISYTGHYVHLSDVALIELGKPLRIGAATAGGEETVLGTVLMNVGANSKKVAQNVEAQIEKIMLPDDVKINVMYSRSYLVSETVKTVSKNLIEGALLVIFVLMFFIGRLSVALCVALAIPLSMAFAILSMRQLHITANLMSLGALDFGLLVDGAVVMIDNIISRIRAASTQLEEHVAEASSQVARPVLLGIGIIILVYIPIFALEGTEGKLFHPMAATVIAALLGSLVIAMVLMPLLGFQIAKKMKYNKPPETRFFTFLARKYHNGLTKVIANTWAIPAYIGLVIAVTVFLFSQLGSEFVPELSEKDIVFGIVRDSKVSLTESIRQQREVESIIKEIPEVEKVFSRMGTPDSATDPMGVNLADTFVILKKDFSGRSEEELIPYIADLISKKFPDSDVSNTQPIQMRFNEMLEGSRADVSLRFYGPDLKELLKYVDESVALLETLPEISEVQVDALTALRQSPALDVKLDFKKLLDHNVNLQTANLTLHMLMAGEPLGFYHDGLWRYPILLRLSEEHRENAEALNLLPVSTVDGGQVLLRDVADIQVENRVTTIARSYGQRYGAVSIFLKGTDVAGFVNKAKKLIQEKISVKPEYRLEWGGQFKNLERARFRLGLIIPLTLLAIFALIYLNFKSLSVSLLILSAIPFAVSGGAFALYILNTPLSVSAAVGFIALMGISILNCMVLIEFIIHLMHKAHRSLKDAVIEGTQARFRPVLMTACVAAFGFLPMIFSQGVGAEVQRPLATVVVGGIVTSTISTLFVIPFLMIRFKWLDPLKDKKV